MDFEDEPTAKRPRPVAMPEDSREDTLPMARAEGAPDTTPEVPERYRPPPGADREVELGRGGIGRVLLVHDAHLGRQVAVKELLRSAMAHGTSTAEVRFLREARVTAQLEHPGIVPVYELGHRDDGSLYYTMRQVRGRTLWDRLQHAGTMRERLRLVPHFTALCQAMAFAHSKGVVHRDLKPQNVMVGEFGETIVLDWGLAKVRGHRDLGRVELTKRSSSQLPTIGETAVGATLGTPAYMSPEQASGRIDLVDERSDVWSLGAVLFELITGRRPFDGASVAEVMDKVRAGKTRSARALEPAAPPELCAIVEKAMQVDRAHRYASAVELAADVASFESGALVRAHEYSTLEILGRFARRHRGVLVTGAVSLLLLLALGAWSVQRVRRERDAADQFATLMITEVADTLEPVQGAAATVERVTRAALDFYGAASSQAHLTPAQRERVAQASQRLGEVALGVGQYDVAREHLTLARQLVAGREALDGQLRLIQIDLAEGDLEDELDRRPEATALWARARSRVEALAAAHPASAAVAHERSRVEDRLGWQASGEGDVDRAVEHFHRSNQHELEAVRLEPGNDRYLSGIVFGRVSLARQLLARGDLARAQAELEAGRQEAQTLLSRAPGVEEFQLRSALVVSWLARVWRYAGRPAEEVAALHALARARLQPIETRDGPSVDSVAVLVDVLLQAGEVARAASWAGKNFALAPSVERALQAADAHLQAGQAPGARVALDWLDARPLAPAPRVQSLLLAAAYWLEQGAAAKAAAKVEEAVTVSAAGGLGMLQFSNATGALAARPDAPALAARALLQRLDGLQGSVDAARLEAAARGR